MSIAALPINELKDLDDLDESEEEELYRVLVEAVDEIQANTSVIQPADSFTELRGVLEGATDEEGREGTEMLHAAREYDKQKDEEVNRRLSSDTDE